MKPLLERKRRARINSCLDEIKELMEYLGGSSDGQRMQRLEKADVLEVTTQYMKQLKANGRLNVNDQSAAINGISTFRSGYSACASEVASFICSPGSGVDQPQAARVAMVITQGLTNITSNNSPSHIQSQTSPPFIQHEVKTETNLESSSDSSLPLDLSVK